MERNVYTRALCHYGIDGMHWGERYHQPYGWGYPLSTGNEYGEAAQIGKGQHQPSWGDIYGKEWKKTQVRMIKDSAIAAGKQSAQKVFDQAKASGYALKARANTYTRSLKEQLDQVREDGAKATFDKWNKRDLGFDADTYRKLGEEANSMYAMKAKANEALRKAQENARQNAFEKRKDLRFQGVKTDESDYTKYMSKDDMAKIERLRKLSDVYDAKNLLAQRKLSVYGQKHSPALNPETKTAYAKQQMQRALERSKAATGRYIQVMAPVMSSPVSDIHKRLLGAKADLQIQRNRRMSQQIVQANYYKTLNEAKRIAQRDIDQELVDLFSGKLNVAKGAKGRKRGLMEEFEYDAD